MPMLPKLNVSSVRRFFVAMEPSAAVFEAIVSHMAEGVIFLDRDDVVRVCNPAAERIRRVRAAKILGRSIFHLHPSKMHHRIGELLTSLKSGTIASSSRVIQAQGRYFDNSYSAILDSSGGYLGTLLVSRDITEQKRLSEENLTLKNSLPGKDAVPFIARSAAMGRVMEMVQAVAALDSTVLVTGENGTGKERVVESIHALSLRRDGPLVRVNCAALPETLVESELFGHARGAFTGAVEDRKGKFELAHGGSLFLDEIGDLSLSSQAKLLRAIQDRVIQPVGGRKEIKVEVRIVAATNRDLAQAVRQGMFREDLFYRLNVIALEMPPLRERREDVLPLADVFLDHFSRAMKKPARSLSPQARDLLLRHPLPGNVRQLKHAMERAVALGKGAHVLVDDLPQELTGLPSGEGAAASPADRPLKEAVGQFEKEYIARALASHCGQKAVTAKALGISRKSLWEKMQRHEVGGAEVP